MVLIAVVVLIEGDVGDSVACESGEMNLGGGATAVPGVPENDALTIGGHRGDFSGGAGDGA